MNADQPSGNAAKPVSEELIILVYSSDRTVRENIRLALGRKVASDLPPIRVVEVATEIMAASP